VRCSLAKKKKIGSAQLKMVCTSRRNDSTKGVARVIFLWEKNSLGEGDLRVQAQEKIRLTKEKRAEQFGRVEELEGGVRVSRVMGRSKF